MAAASRAMFLGRNIAWYNVTGAFSAADETNTVIIDKSTITGPDGTEPTSICVEEVTWSIGAGFDYILLEWDHTTDAVLDYFQGQGYIDYTPFGGKNDTEAAGDTGDLILTSAGGAAGDTYTFLIKVRFKD